MEIARWRGYTAVMFNLVFETNIASLKLWQSLGFETIGRIPAAAHLKKRWQISKYLNAVSKTFALIKPAKLITKI